VRTWVANRFQRSRGANASAQYDDGGNEKEMLHGASANVTDEEKNGAKSLHDDVALSTGSALFRLYSTSTSIPPAHLDTRL
jgi:hypothetical protein